MTESTQPPAGRSDPPERVVVLVDVDHDGIRITGIRDGVTYRTPVPLLSPDVAREQLAAVLPWVVARGGA